MREMKMKALQDLIQKMYEMEAGEEEDNDGSRETNEEKFSTNPPAIRTDGEEHALQDFENEALEDEEDEAIKGNDENPLSLLDPMREEMKSFMRAGKEVPIKGKTQVRIAITSAKPTGKAPGKSFAMKGA